MRTALAAAGVAVALLTGCSGEPESSELVESGQGDAGAGTDTTVTPTSSPTPAPTPTRSPSRSASASPRSDDGSSTSPGTSSPDPDDAPIVTSTSSAAEGLTLSDFFTKDGWSEGEVQIPRQPEAVQAITTELASQYTGEDCRYAGDDLIAPPLELRLAAESGTITFTVGQALDSATSDTLLDAKLLADNRTVETATVPFAESRTLSTPVDGVSSVKLQVAVNADSPSCSATVVVRDVQLTSG